MKLLVVSQMFWPENFRVNDLVGGLVERGHEVTVLTGMPNYPEGRYRDGYGLRGPWTQEYRGATLIRVPLIPRGRGGGIRLALNYLSFAIAGSLLGPLRCRGHYDAIFVFGPSPVTVGLPAIAIKLRVRAPIFFWVLDLWPESIAAVGAIRSRRMLALVGWLVRYIYSRCDWILVQSRAFIESVRGAGVSSERILYFPSWAESIFTAEREAAALDAAAALPEGFRVVFAGNIGAAQDFPTILAAASRLRNRTDIQWIIVGDGRMAREARAEVARLGLRHVHFLGQLPVERMPVLFAQADALLVSLRPDPVFSRTIPGKVQAYLASGRPIVGMLDGEGARVIEESRAGVTCPPGDPERLANAIDRLAGLPRIEREMMGGAGQAYYARHFDRELLFERLERWFRGVDLPSRPTVGPEA